MKSFLFALLCFTTMLTSTVDAGLVINVQDTQLVAGGTGHVDVMITGMGDNVSSINYEFTIASIGGNAGFLRFADPQSSLNTSTPEYIFSGDSGGLAGVVLNSPAFDSFIGGDFKGDFGDVAVTSALLVRLDVEHLLPGGTSSALAASDQFTIQLANTPNTFAFDSGFAPATIEIDSFGGDASGKVTFVATAVPEPSTALLFVGGVIIMVLRRNRGFQLNSLARVH